jgi:hypothetical protein
MEFGLLTLVNESYCATISTMPKNSRPDIGRHYLIAILSDKLSEPCAVA